MHTKLARSTKELGGVFVENQLVKVILLKIDKRLIDLALSKMIIIVVETCKGICHCGVV